MGVNSLPKTVTRQRRDCDLNPDSSAPESSTLTTRLPSHPCDKANVYLALLRSPAVFRRTGHYRLDWRVDGGTSLLLYTGR